MEWAVRTNGNPTSGANMPSAAFESVGLPASKIPTFYPTLDQDIRLHLIDINAVACTLIPTFCRK
jgi:hypothetical protein